MSNNRNQAKRAVFALVSGAVLLAAAPQAAFADGRRHHEWRGGHNAIVIRRDRGRHYRHDRRVRKVIVVRPRHVVRRPVRVVHVHRPPVRTVRVVKVVRHRYVPAPAYTPYYGSPRLSRSTGGALIGALLGAVTGSQIGKGNGRTVAVAAGAVLGAVVGGEVGRSMDRADRLHVQRTLETMPTGRSTQWVNPDSGTEYTVTPTRTYRSAQLGNCREYEAWAFIGGYEQRITGTACRRPDGSWQKVAS